MRGDTKEKARNRHQYRDELGAPLNIGGKHVCARGSCNEAPPTKDARYCTACAELEDRPSKLELGRRRPQEW